MLPSASAWAALREHAKATGAPLSCDPPDVAVEEEEGKPPSPDEVARLRYRDVVPAIRGPHWPGRGDAIAGRLVSDGTTDQPTCSYAVKAGPLVGYIGTLSGSGTHVTAVDRLARENLRACPFETKVLRERRPDGETISIVAIEGPLAAERVLDDTALQRLSSSLGRPPEMAVALPRIGLLLAAAAGDESDPVLGKLARRRYDEAAEEDRIWPGLLLVSRGKLTGFCMR